jgi:DNA-directed RNA polymerase specialized sigma24 family protein
MTTTCLAPERRRALGAFYAEHHRRLAGRVRSGARGVRAPIVADACAYAWLQLIRRPDIRLDRGGLTWLALVAIQEAWRLGAPGCERAVGLFLTEIDDERELPDPAGAAADPLERTLDRELHQARAARFAGLKASERRDLLLHAGGYSYLEIADLTHSTYSAVNRRLTDGRNRLRAN